MDAWSAAAFLTATRPSPDDGPPPSALAPWQRLFRDEHDGAAAARAAALAMRGAAAELLERQLAAPLGRDGGDRRGALCLCAARSLAA